jgi:hypothetical protein
MHNSGGTRGGLTADAILCLPADTPMAKHWSSTHRTRAARLPEFWRGELAAPPAAKTEVKV